MTANKAKLVFLTLDCLQVLLSFATKQKETLLIDEEKNIKVSALAVSLSLIKQRDTKSLKCHSVNHDSV